MIIVLPLSVFVYKSNTNNTDQSITSDSNEEETTWVWENPMTFHQVSIPSVWRITEGEQVQDAVLALEHKSGKSLVYIINEEPNENMSLSDFVEALKLANQKELGTDEFELTNDEYGDEIFQAEGARYLGKSMVATQVRVWSNGPYNFWRTVTMTNSEYKALGFEAQNLVEILAESTW